MVKKWIDPIEIYLADHLNPRQLNQGFIESLVESMQEEGFLPQYPVKVFEVKALTCIEPDDKHFACVSGMHRTTAAQLAKVEKILCEVHAGDDDDFIEMMMTDNFEYDPKQNSEIGQVFSQREKREACKRLLYIPKFLHMTNTALSKAWHTSEVNIRRWRKEVASSIDEGAAIKLKMIGLTPERIQELKGILESREREDADGNIVPIRTTPKEPTEEEKGEFWDQIREDAGWHDDGWLEKHGIKDFDNVREYLSEKLGVENSYRIYEGMTMRQLRDVHGAILSDDPEFIAGCKVFAERYNRIRSLGGELREACGSIKKWLLDEFVKGNEWSDEYKACRKDFEAAAQRAGHSDFHVEVYDFPTKESSPESFEQAIEIVASVQRDVASILDSDDPATWVIWVSEFRKEMEKKTLANRQKLEKQWVTSKQSLAEAFTAYPRNVSPGAFCLAMDDEYHEKSGTHFKLFSLDKPSNRVHDDKITYQIKNFNRAAKDLEDDAKWVQAIPAEDGSVLNLQEYADFQISHIYIEVAGTNGKVFHPEGAVFGNKKNDFDEDGNPKSKGLNLDAEALACLSDTTKADILNVCRKNKFQHYTHHFHIGGPREEHDEG